MKLNKIDTAIVIESYDHEESQVVVAYQPEGRLHHFFYLPKYPEVHLGDHILIDLKKESYIICCLDQDGKDILPPIRIHPITFPGTLLIEIMTDRFIDEGQK